MMDRLKISRRFMKDPSKVGLYFLREGLDIGSLFIRQPAKTFLPEIRFDSSS